MSLGEEMSEGGLRMNNGTRERKREEPTDYPCQISPGKFISKSRSCSREGDHTGIMVPLPFREIEDLEVVGEDIYRPPGRPGSS